MSFVKPQSSLKFDFKGQTIMVTGGGSGIGLGVAKQLAKSGANVIIAGRTLGKLEQVKAEIESAGGICTAVQMDVSDPKSVDKVFDDLFSNGEPLHGLVSNAGNISAPAFAVDMPYEDFDSVVRTHVYGTFMVCKRAGQIMRRQKYGRIVITTSVARKNGFMGYVNYAVSKAALREGMIQTLAKELGPDGITVNGMEPGIVETPMADGFLKEMGEVFAKETPVRRIGKTTDTANVIMFFLSPDAEFLSGEILGVTGGFLLNSNMDTYIESMLRPEEK